MPANLNGAVKLRISALNNIFYAVSPAINVAAAPTSAGAAPTGVSAISTEIFKTTARVSWNKVSGATYSINYRKTGAANWSNTTSTTNSVVLNALEDESNYEVQVAAVVNSVPGTFSNNYTFKTKGLTGTDYCLMTTGGNGIFNSGLISLNLSDLNYAAAGVDYFKTYLDFSEDATKLINLEKGVQYTVNFRNIAATRQLGQPYRDWFEIWIDYNRNGEFENSEKVVSNNALPNLTGSSTYARDGNATFTVPDTAYAGDKTLRMRVASTFMNAASGPCGSATGQLFGGVVSGGSFRDFSVRIADNNALAAKDVVKNPNAEISIYPNPADTFVEVRNLKETADYKIHDASGRLTQEGTVQNQKINVAGLTKGLYILTLKTKEGVNSVKLIKK